MRGKLYDFINSMNSVNYVNFYRTMLRRVRYCYSFQWYDWWRPMTSPSLKMGVPNASLVTYLRSLVLAIGSA